MIAHTANVLTGETVTPEAFELIICRLPNTTQDNFEHLNMMSVYQMIAEACICVYTLSITIIEWTLKEFLNGVCLAWLEARGMLMMATHVTLLGRSKTCEAED